MNEASRWRRDLAQARIAPAYAALDKVVAIALVGGVARGLADSWSDLDLVVYWLQSPETEARRAIPAALGGQDLSLDDREIRRPDLALQSRGDRWYLGGDARSGLKIDVTHKLTISMDKLVLDLVQRHDADRLKMAEVHSLQRAQALYGASLIEAWAEAAGRLPGPVAAQLARDSLPSFAPWSFEMLGEREDPLLYAGNMSRALGQLVCLLHAANFAYPPRDLKHLETLCSELGHAPPELAGRIATILEARPLDASRLLARLGGECLELAARQLPALAPEIDAARDRLRHRRARFVAAPRMEDSDSRAGL